jgi:GGDEF domain-containing protein
MCLLMVGMLSQPTVLFGLSPARVEHPECELHGDARCRYGILDVTVVDRPERLRAAVATAPVKVPVRVSVGLASWPAEASDAAELLERADAALYAAKRSGKDRVALASAA